MTAVVLAVVAVVLTTVAAAVRVAREPLDSLVRRGRTTSGRWTLGPLDAFLIAAVGTGVLAFVTGSLSGPFALAGPALLALFAGLLLGHLAAPTASASGRRLLRRGRLVAGVTLLEMGRRRETRAVIAVITVASALAVFAVDALVVGERNRANASEHDAGAPVVLRDGGTRPGRGAGGAQRCRPHGPTSDTGHGLGRPPWPWSPTGSAGSRFFPRGAPTAAQWRAIAPPDKEPVDTDGIAVLARPCGPADDLTSKDALGRDSEVDLGLAVTTGTGTRRTIQLGDVAAGRRAATLVGTRLGVRERAAGWRRWSSRPPGVGVEGDLDLSDLRVDGRPVDWAASAEDWNTTEDEQHRDPSEHRAVRRCPAPAAGHAGQLPRRG